MTDTKLRERVLRALAAIVPEADFATLRGDLAFREQLAIDSMDFLNFIIALHKDLKVDIPERDYPRLVTLDGCVSYLTAALAKQRIV